MSEQNYCQVICGICSRTMDLQQSTTCCADCKSKIATLEAEVVRIEKLRFGADASNRQNRHMLEQLQGTHATLLVALESNRQERDAIKYRLKELEQEQAALIIGLRVEFTKGEFSGDIVQDFGTFFEHHKAVEKRSEARRGILEYIMSAPSNAAVFQYIDREEISELAKP